MNSNFKKEIEISFDQKLLKGKRRSELIEIIHTLTESINAERKNNIFINKKAKIFEDIFKNEQLADFLKNILSFIPIKATSSIRIMCVESDNFLQPFQSGYGKLEHDYSILDYQVNELLGGKNQLLIQDTSKIHNLKFTAEKEFPRSIIAFPIILMEKKYGCIWVGDENYNSFSTKEQKELTENIHALQHVLAILIRRLFENQENKTNRQILDSIEDPIIVINANSKVSYVNLSAMRVFEMKRENDNSYFSNKLEKDQLINSGRIQDGSIVRIDDTEYKVIAKKCDFDNCDEGLICRFNNKTIERSMDNYLSTIISALTQSMESPLDEIKGLASLVLSLGNLSVKQQKYLDRLIQKTFLINKDITDLLSLKRLKREGFIAIEPFKIDEVIEEVLEKLSPLIKQKQIIVSKNYEVGEQKIICDRLLLEHILLNVFDHAIHETRLGGTIELERFIEPARFKVSIKDSGRGISKPDIEKALDKRIFDKHQEALQLAMKITALLNGEVSIESNLGSGTKVTLEISQKAG